MLKRDRVAIIRQHYPNAITTIDSVNRFIDLLENRFSLEPSQMMLADSICSDDVNSIQYPARALEFRGPFKMGGLDGFPFTGLTGMGAFAGHVPDDGAVFLYYGPHIGVSKNGAIGEIMRVGQHLPTGCCGAARGALAKLIAGQIETGCASELDYQMNKIEQILVQAKERVLGAEIPLKEATEVIYEAIDERMETLVAATPYPCRYVFMMGAVLINSDSDMGSFSETKKLIVIDRETGERQDLLAEYLG
jgi:Limiting CO2-inducible proteins B/C beta carbonyic anhydrases